MSTMTSQDQMAFIEKNPFDEFFSLYDHDSTLNQKSAKVTSTLPVHEELDTQELETPGSFYSVQSTDFTPVCEELSPQELRTPASSFSIDQSARASISSEPSRTIPLPIVVPQNSNIFFVKHLSPFARCYPPALNSIDNPISQEEFLHFLDGLNDVFVAHPGFLATIMVGGALIGSSGIASYIRVRNYLEKANRDLFKQKGLKAQIVTTKKMMASVGISAGREKGRLVLCELDEKCEEDPRERRLRSLDGYVSPLNFDVPNQVTPTQTFKKILSAPTTFNERIQMNLLLNSRKKIFKTLNSSNETGNDDETRIANLEKAISECHIELNETSLDIDLDTKSAKEHIDIHNLRAYLTSLEAELALEKHTRDGRLQKSRASQAKEFAKIDRQENKIVNRILWLVISRDDGKVVSLGRNPEEMA